MVEWLKVIGIGFAILTGLASIYKSFITTGNHYHTLKERLDKIDEKLDCIEKKTFNQEGRIGVLEGRTEGE